MCSPDDSGMNLRRRAFMSDWHQIKFWSQLIGVFIFVGLVCLYVIFFFFSGLDFFIGRLTVDCADWNSKLRNQSAEYFQAAAVEDVADCLQSGADPNARSESKWFPGLLLEFGADIKARGEYYYTPLHWAARYSENPAIIAVLLEAGADLEAQDSDGETSLHLAAAFNENPLVIAALLEAGAYIKARDRDGETPLHLAAAYNENPAVITVLLEAGADLEVPISHSDDYVGRPPLYWHMASWRGRNENGYTLLHLAARYNENPLVIAALLEAGADPTAEDAAGKKPWDHAKGREPLKGSDAYWRLNEGQF